MTTVVIGIMRRGRLRAFGKAVLWAMGLCEITVIALIVKTHNGRFASPAQNGVQLAACIIYVAGYFYLRKKRVLGVQEREGPAEVPTKGSP